MSFKMDDVKIRYKLILLYVLTVLLPLVLTDTIIIYATCNQEQKLKKIQTENMADTVITSFNKTIDTASALGIYIYKDSYINDCLVTKYNTPLDYLIKFQEFQKMNVFSTGLSLNGFKFTMYADNPTIVNGGQFQKIENAVKSKWYYDFKTQGKTNMLYFDFNPLSITSKRKIVLLRPMDYYDKTGPERILKIDIDYAVITQRLTDLNYSRNIYVCSNDKIILSNSEVTNVGSPYETLDKSIRMACRKNFLSYGKVLTVYVEDTPMMLSSILRNHILGFLLLVGANIVLPLLFLMLLNHSFTKRISIFTSVIKHSHDEKLKKVAIPFGKDEIGFLIQNYNKMVDKIQTLIEKEYKSKIREQNMIVSRQKAELLALQGQINPHFLFNILESIRMHSVLKHEDETAAMIQRLAIIQRQYVSWGSDSVKVSKEIECVSAYLELQKYRFGDRLNYKLDISDSCKTLYIPKLSIVTFVENACIHGLENKNNPSWIFVRVKKSDDFLVIEIEDTGSGMEQQEKDEILDRMNNANIDMLQTNGRVGIVNACLRLKLASNDTVEFELDSEPGEGTCFTIKVPLLWSQIFLDEEDD